MALVTECAFRPPRHCAAEVSGPVKKEATKAADGVGRVKTLVGMGTRPGRADTTRILSWRDAKTTNSGRPADGGHHLRATSRPNFGLFSAWSFRATPQAAAIRSGIRERVARVFRVFETRIR